MTAAAAVAGCGGGGGDGSSDGLNNYLPSKVVDDGDQRAELAGTCRGVLTASPREILMNSAAFAWLLS